MTARNLVARCDPADVDRSAIVDSAGVSSEDFDHHFESMPTLWKSVADAMVDDMAQVQRNLYGKSSSVPDRLSRTLEFALDTMEQNPDELRAIRRMVDEPGPGGEQARSMLKGILTEITCQLGLLHGWKGEPELTSQCLYAQILRIYDHWQAHPERMTRERVEPFVFQLLGLRRSDDAVIDN